MKKYISILLLSIPFIVFAQNGEVKEYYDTGELKIVWNFVNDIEQGPAIAYYKNGNIATKATMRNGEQHGVSFSYYENGNNSEETTYVDGWENGPFKTFWETGELKEKGTYITVYKDGEYDDTLKTGAYKAYLPSGETAVIGSFAIDEYNEEIEIGPWIKKDYYGDDLSNLTLKEDYKLLNGEYHGICKDYYENGQIETTGEYRNGEEEGIHKEYYENGQLKTTGEYRNGEQEGIHKEYYENGQLETLATYVNGKTKGWYEEYWSDGKPRVKGNAEPAGGWSTHSEGDPWTEWKYYNNDQLREKVTYNDDGEKHGPYEKYHENGDLKEKGQYTNGKEEGEWYLNYTDTNKRFKQLYENGVALKSKNVNSEYDSMEDEFYKLIFKNKCHKPVQVVLRYKTLDGDWEFKGFFTVDSYDESYLVDMKNRIYYYYAQSTDGKNKWSGDESKTFNDYKLGFKKKTIPEGKDYGDYYLSITCDD